MNNDRIVLKSKSNFLSIPTGTIISVSYHGGMALEITYKTEGSKSLFDFSQRGGIKLLLFGLTLMKKNWKAANILIFAPK